MQSTLERTTVHVRRAVEGDRDSLGWVVHRFTPFVESQVRFRLGGGGSHHDVEDATAEVWLIALRKIDQLCPREERFAPVLVSYLGTTAVQVCNNILRRLARSVHLEQPLPAQDDELARETKGLVSRFAQEDLADKIRGCLERMQEHAREVLVLRLMEQLSNVEIAELLDIPANTVSVRYRRALEQLRSILPPEAFDEVRSAAVAF